MQLRLCLLVLAALAAVQEAPSEGQRWWSHVEFLASDALEGRNVGTAGFEKAAAYVENQFQQIGLKPGGTAGYRQPVRLESRVLIPDHTRLTLMRNGQQQSLVPGEDATLSGRGELDGSLEAPMVFIGYGVSIPEAQWDELAGVDLRGKIAVYVTAPPPADAPDNVKSHVGSAGERWAALRKAGAIGVATLSTRPPTVRPTPTFPQPAVLLADPALQESVGMQVSAAFTRPGAEKLLAGSGHTIDELDRVIAEKKPLPRFPIAGTLRVETKLERAAMDSANLIGIYDGSDPRLKAEFVVMSAHLDHVGIGRPVDGDAIYNGAMDDASGVAAMIEIARMLKASSARLKRSIAFVAVTAEEKGLLGSKYFAARPTVPFENIVADVNLDMFLPLYPLKVIEVQGLTESTLGDRVRAAAVELGVDVQTDREPEQNRFIRSDQYSFIRRGVPSLAFKFGYESGSAEEKIRRDWVRDVYHKPNDDVKQPVDIEAAARFNRVILGLLERVANDGARPTWYDTSFFKRFSIDASR